ncbi:MAG: hypothetical protein P9L91_03215 [Candidatus Zophobacter franzmannii]|nr:hypothetical protein [Candidatus Zophobacter franzmannii]
MNRISTIFIILFLTFVVHFIFASIVMRSNSHNDKLQSRLYALKNSNETLTKEYNYLTSRDRIESIAEGKLKMIKGEFLKDDIEFVLLDKSRKDWGADFLGKITSNVLAADRK